MHQLCDRTLDGMGGRDGRTNPKHIRDPTPGAHAENHTERERYEEEEKLRQQEENLAKMQQTGQ